MASIWHVYIYMNSWHLESHKLPRATDTQKLWLNFFGSYSRVAFRSSTPDIQLFAMENHQCNRCTVDGNQKSGEKTHRLDALPTRTVNSGDFNYLSLNLWPSDFCTINSNYFLFCGGSWFPLMEFIGCGFLDSPCSLANWPHTNLFQVTFELFPFLFPYVLWLIFM